MLINKDNIKGTSPIALGLRKINTDYDVAHAVVQMYQDNAASICGIIPKEDIIACHRYYLNMHYNFVQAFFKTGIFL